MVLFSIQNRDLHLKYRSDRSGTTIFGFPASKYMGIDGHLDKKKFNPKSKKPKAIHRPFFGPKNKVSWIDVGPRVSHVKFSEECRNRVARAISATVFEIISEKCLKLSVQNWCFFRSKTAICTSNIGQIVPGLRFSVFPRQNTWESMVISTKKNSTQNRKNQRLYNVLFFGPKNKVSWIDVGPRFSHVKFSEECRNRVARAI